MMTPAERAKDKKYKQSHKEEIAAWKRAYNEANKEKIAADGKAYRLANKEYLTAYWKSKEPAKREKNQSGFRPFMQTRLSASKSADKTKGRKNDLDIDRVIGFLEKQNKKCAATGIEVTHNYYDLSAASIDRIDSNKGHTVLNCQIVCAWFNFAKGNASNDDALALIREIRGEDASADQWFDSTVGVSKECLAQQEKALVELLKERVRRAREKDAKNHREFNIDFPYVLEMYETQNGRCAATNCLLSLDRKDALRVLSIDRIDSTKGHAKENIQLVIHAYNVSKMDRPDAEARAFIQKIRDVKNPDAPDLMAICNTDLRYMA